MAEDPLYELRIYHVAPGRAGDMRKRLEVHLLKLFRRHGIRMMGCWEAETESRDPLFIYVAAYPSFAARTEAWARFYADPEWIAARAATNAGSDLVLRTDLYPLRKHQIDPSALAAADELVMLRLAIGGVPAAVSSLLSRKPDGVRLGGVFEPFFGEDLPRMVLFAAGRGDKSLDPLENEDLGRRRRIALTGLAPSEGPERALP